jgi:GT2 family glycosyltransferase
MTPRDGVEPRHGAPSSAGTIEAPSAPSVGTRLCAIVLNWQGEHDTAACLDSLLVQRGVEMDILLVDNASPDGSGERLRARYPSVAFLQTGDNLGYAGGNNLGIEWARERGAEWLLVVNNDTVADPDCVRRLLDAARSDARIGALAPLIVRFDEPERVWFAGGRHDRARAVGVHDHWNEPTRAALADDAPPTRVWRECSFVTGCCLLLRRAALDEVGLFRADFFAYVEDLELSVRFRRHGWRTGWVPQARLAHRVPPVGAPLTPLQIRLRDRNRRRVVRDAYPLAWRVLFSLWFWPTRVAHLARYLLRGDRPRAAAIVMGMTER